MSNATTAIEWTDATWNPVHGCSKVSPGCAHCYAETLSLRFGHTTRPWTPANAAENVQLKPDRLDQPLKWRKPRMVFVNSMSDLFHEDVPYEFVDSVFGVMAGAAQHTFQVLTKRPERMQEYLTGPRRRAAIAYASVNHVEYDDPDLAWNGIAFNDPWPLPNVWLGVSIENRRYVHRADVLRDTPAAVRFISAEPLLGPLAERMSCGSCWEWPDPDCDECEGLEWWWTMESLDLRDIDWLIVGGESGPKHRPIKEQWVRDLRDMAKNPASGTAFFFKQWGGRTPKAGGRELDGRTWDEMPARRGFADDLDVLSRAALTPYPPGDAA